MTTTTTTTTPRTSTAAAPLLLALAALLLVAAPPRPAAAFDIGHHFDVTRNALRNAGFGEEAVRAAQLYNWLTDFKSNNFLSDEQPWMKRAHFDNMVNSEMLAADFERFATNARGAVRSAAADGDALGVLAVLGVSLHSVQDYYAHSNWVERFAGAAEDSCYGTRANTDPAVLEAQDLLTGLVPDSVPDNEAYASALAGREATALPQHGSYLCGVNKDSYINDRWMHTRRYAYFATLEWAAQLQAWAAAESASVWAEAQAWEPPSQAEADALDYGLDGARKIAMWTKVPFKDRHDGHWKGPGSGSTAQFAAESAAYVVNADFFESALMRQLTELRRHRAVFDGLMEGQAAPAAPAAIAPLDGAEATEVIVRAFAVAETGSLRADAGSNRPDLYLLTTVDGYTYRDAVQQDERSAAPSWTTVTMYETAPENVTVSLRLRDEDYGNADEEMDLNPDADKLTLDFTYTLATGELSGDVSGAHRSEAEAVETEGDASLRARLSFYVTHRRVRACASEEVPDPLTAWEDCSAALALAAAAAAAGLA